MLIHLFSLMAVVSKPSTYQHVQDTNQYYAHGAFAQIDQHGTGPARIHALCAKGRPADFNHLADLQDRLAQLLERDSSLTVIEDLACARALLFALGAPHVREAPGMPVGQSWGDGAMSAAARGLQRFPGNAELAELLGIILQEVLPARHPVAPDPNGERMDTRNTDLPAAAAAIYGAVQLGARSPGLFRSCASLMIDLGDLTTAHDCSIRALAEGHDSTWHLLRLASIAFVTADTVTAMKAMELAALTSHDAPARAELGWHLESAASQCRACMVAGAMNPSGTQNYRPGDYLSATERGEWFALPDSGVSLWIGAAIKDRLPLQDGEGYNRLKGLATPLLSAVWRQASLIPATLIRHFLYTSYGGGTFRACERDPFGVSCWPSVPDDKHHLALAADVWRLWDPASGAPIQVLGLALPVRGLAFTGSGPNRSATVDVHFRQWTLPGVWRDTGFVRQIRVSESAGDDGTWFASVIVPGAELPSWSVMVSQSTLRRGGAHLEVRPTVGGTDLELSDLVLGSAEQPLAWQNGVTAVPLAPIHAFSRKQSIQLYYQVRADTARPSVNVSITVRRIVDGLPTDESVLSMAFATTVKRGINEAQRELDHSHLPSGDYELGVEIQRPGGVRIHRTTLVAVQ
jgi:hypothetical protein